MSVDQEPWGTTVSGGSRRGRRRVLRSVGIGLLVLVLLGLVYGVGVGMYASARIDRVEVETLQRGGGPLHILVVGSDSREGLTPEQQRELTTGEAGGERTDTIFIMTIEGGRVGLLAFPRDLLVTRCDGSQGRINAAMQIDGPACLVQTVQDLSGIEIDHYLEVSFLGFRDIVEAVGGVTVCLDQPIKDDFAGIDLPAGCQRLTGPQALGYVRVRKIDNDLERIKRQQGFLKALAQEVMSPSTILNPVRLIETAGDVGDALTADEGLGVIDLARLAFGMRGLAGGASVTETVPATPDTVGGAAVLRIEEDAAQELFRSFADGSVLERARGGDAPDPSEISVTVLNGAGVTGLAGQTAEALRAEGFQVADIGDTDPVDATTVAYPAGQEAAAQVVADALPVEAELREDGSVATVTVLLGADVGS